MIKEKDLCKIGQVRYKDGDTISLKSIRDDLAAVAANYGIPAKFVPNEIKYGGLIGSRTEKCLVLVHPEFEKKYNNYVIVITRQAKYAFVDLYLGGSSKQGMALEAKEQISSGSFSSLSSWNQGVVVGSLIGSAVSGVLFHGSNKIEAEKNWYIMIKDILQEVFEIEFES